MLYNMLYHTYTIRYYIWYISYIIWYYIWYSISINMILDMISCWIIFLVLLITMDLFWFHIFVQWDVSTTTVLSCPSHLLGGLLAFSLYWSRAHARTTMLCGNGTGAWTSTTAVWTRLLPRSMSFVLRTGIFDLQTERWGRGGVSGTYWVWMGWRFLTRPCALLTNALCVSVPKTNWTEPINIMIFDTDRKSNLWSKRLRRSC